MSVQCPKKLVQCTCKVLCWRDRQKSRKIVVTFRPPRSETRSRNRPLHAQTRGQYQTRFEWLYYWLLFISYYVVSLLLVIMLNVTHVLCRRIFCLCVVFYAASLVQLANYAFTMRLIQIGSITCAFYLCYLSCGASVPRNSGCNVAATTSKLCKWPHRLITRGHENPSARVLSILLHLYALCARVSELSHKTATTVSV